MVVHNQWLIQALCTQCMVGGEEIGAGEYWWFSCYLYGLSDTSAKSAMGFFLLPVSADAKD